MFSQLTDSLENTLKNLRGQGKLTEENVAESLREVRRAFLAADVNFNVTRDFVKSVKEKSMGAEVLNSVTPGQQIVKIIHDELVSVMGGETKEINLSGPAPVGIMMVGLQGSGKTTFAGKIALWMRSKKKRKPLLVAADVYRPAAIKQLQVLGKKKVVCSLGRVGFGGDTRVDSHRRPKSEGLTFSSPSFFQCLLTRRPLITGRLPAACTSSSTTGCSHSGPYW